MSHVIDTTAIGYQLKKVYGDKITDLFARHTMTYNLFNKSNRKASYKPGGEGYYFAARQGDIESVGARGQGHKLPHPGDPAGVQFVVSPKLIYGVLKLAGLAVEAGKSNVMAFANVQGDAISNVYKSLVNDLNRQCHGNGTGLLGTLTGTLTIASTTGTGYTVALANDRGVRYFKKGMCVDFYESAALATGSSAAVVTAINPNTQVITVSANGNYSYKSYHPTGTITAATDTLASGTYVVRYGARASTHSAATTYEMMGLLGLYDDGTALSSFQGQTISSYPEFKANRLTNSSVNRELSIDLMLAGMDMTAARSGEMVDIIRMGLGQRRKYFGLLANDVRYAPGKFLGGYETLDFAQNGRVQIIVDPHTQPNRIFMEPRDTIKKYELTPIGWGGMDNQKMHWREGYDEAYMFLRVYTNLGVEQRNALTVIEDLTEPSSMPF